MKQTNVFFATLMVASVSISSSQFGLCYGTGQSTLANETTFELIGLEGRKGEGNTDKKASTDPAQVKMVQLLKASRDLAIAKKYDEALAKLNELDAIAGRTAEVKYGAERTRVAIAYAVKNEAMLSKSLEAVLASGQLPAAEKLNFIQELAGSYYRQKNYPQAITEFTRYASEGGTDKDARAMLIKAYYFNSDYTNASKQLQADIQAAEAAGKAPSEEQLQLLLSCAIKLKDDAASLRATEKFVAYYPKKEQWTELLNRLVQQPGFSDRLMLDVYRLMLVTDQITTTDDFVSMAQLALQSGYPEEAKKIIALGYKAGVLGTGADAATHQHLRSSAEKSADAKLKNAAKEEAALSKARNNNGLVELGYNYVLAGQFDKGIKLMEQGILAGGLARPEDANLHLAIAHVLAGHKTDALQSFKAVKGTDGTAELARYWTLQMHSL